MKAKDNDIIEFLAIAWEEPQWEFDHPTVILSPAVRYSPNGESPQKMIEDLAIDFVCDEEINDHDYSEEFNWRSWKLSRLKKVANERLKGLDTWKTKIKSVIKQRIRFFEKNGELEFEILETINA